MRPVIKKATIVCGILFASIQLVRPARVNPPIDANRTLNAVIGMDNRATQVIDRSCRDCHSNETNWPWYSTVSPASWLIARDVEEGRKVLNFSEWADYRPDQRRKLLKKSCEEVREREMPLAVYTLLHRTATLTPTEIADVCKLMELKDS